METRAHYIVIGFTTLAVTVAALLFALWLSKSGVTDNSNAYDILFTESVTGLSVGSPVLYNGIRMGEVTSLRLDKKDPRNVKARIAISNNVPVTEATRARLTIANITGAAVIQLVAGPPGSPPLTAAEGRVPVIEASPSPFTQLRNSSEELLVNIANLTENASLILSEDNANNFNKILANIETITATLAGEKETIAATLKQLSRASIEIQATMAEFSRLLATTNSTMDKHGEKIVLSARDSLESLENLSRILERLVVDNEGAINQGVQGLAEVGPVLRELRATINTLGNISRRLNEDPGGYLLGSEKIQEYDQ